MGAICPNAETGGKSGHNSACWSTELLWDRHQQRLGTLTNSAGRLSLRPSWGRCQLRALKLREQVWWPKACPLGRAQASHPFCWASFMLCLTWNAPATASSSHLQPTQMLPPPGSPSLSTWLFPLGFCQSAPGSLSHHLILFGFYITFKLCN